LFLQLDESEVPADPAEKLAKAQAISTTRFLTQDEFKKIRQRQMNKELQADPRNRIKGLKRKAGDAKIHVEDDEKEQ
jgi:hypothetical protein